MQAALAALHWMSMDHGYGLTGLDVHEALRLAIEAAASAQQTEQAQATIDQALAQTTPCRLGCGDLSDSPAAAS